MTDYLAHLLVFLAGCGIGVGIVTVIGRIIDRWDGEK